MKKHNKKLSILRGIGIFLVVLGHTNSILVKYIYFFHLPLLYFLSGYFLKGNFKTIKEGLFYFREKFSKLYFPFLKYVIPMIFCTIYFIK